MKRNFMALALVGTLGVGILCAPLSVRASEEGKKNTAIALGVGAAALLLTQRNKTPGIVVAVGAAIAYKGYDDDVKARHRRDSRYREHGDNRDYRDNCDNRVSHRYGVYDNCDANARCHRNENSRDRDNNGRSRDRYNDDDSWFSNSSNRRNRDEECDNRETSHRRDRDDRNDSRSNDRRNRDTWQEDSGNSRSARARSNDRVSRTAAERLNRSRSERP